MPLVYEEPLVQVFQGHVLDEMTVLAPQSVQLICTSPPYFGLRSYQVEPQCWGGDPACAHVWGEERSRVERRRTDKGLAFTGTGSPETRLPGLAEAGFISASQGQFCQTCHAWCGHLGLEARPWCAASLQGQPCADACYLGHLLQVCDGIWRILRNDGCFIINLGDSFAQAQGHGHWESRHGEGDEHAQKATQQWAHRGAEDIGLKPKSLMNIPARLSIALQAKGWILRSKPPWLKKNGMPSSQDDRPTVSHEDLFLFTKSGDYFWDQDAIRQPHARIWRDNNGGTFSGGKDSILGGTYAHTGAYPVPNPNGRTRRTSDWWFESLDAVIADTEAWLAHAKSVRDHGGLLLSPEGEPLGLSVNPQPFKGSHFAVFPDNLVRPVVLAATSQHGACTVCGTPWSRVVAKSSVTPIDYEGKWAAADPQANSRRILANTRARRQAGAAHDHPFPSPKTLAWAPGCACGGSRLRTTTSRRLARHPWYRQHWQARLAAKWPAVEPCTVMDVFAGRGTSGYVARSLGRKSILIELSESYVQLIKDTLKADLPLFPDDPELSHAVEQLALFLTSGHQETQDTLNFNA